jgi:hypothetical protein
VANGIRTLGLLVANSGENKLRQGATITYLFSWGSQLANLANRVLLAFFRHLRLPKLPIEVLASLSRLPFAIAAGFCSHRRAETNFTAGRFGQSRYSQASHWQRSIQACPDYMG